MDVITYALAKKMGGGGESITYTLTADTENKTIVLTPSRGTAQVITVPYATDASTVNGHEVPELENGKIPANFLPSFVDNVDEYDNINLFPVVGESNRIYIDKSTNKTYRWSGTAYVEISESIALGETSSTAYRGDRGKIAYDHSQSAHAPSNAEANQNAFSNVKIDSDIINASTATDTLEFIAGDNIILTPNVSNKKITVSQAPVRKSASGDIASFSDGTGDPFLEVKVNIEPVQSGSGDPSPSNVRPISGWSGADVKKYKAYQIFEATTNSVTQDGVTVTYKGKGKYSIRGTKTISTSLRIEIPVKEFVIYDGTDPWIRFNNTLSSNLFNLYFKNGDTDVENWVLQPLNRNTGYLGMRGKTVNTLVFGDTGTPAGTSYDFSVQIEIYSNSSETVSSVIFRDGETPITVYGGRLNVTSGELTVTHANIASYNGETINEPWISSMDVYSAGATPTTGAQVVYPLATPQTYQLTPAQVSTLLGQNNIFADCGQIEVAYKTPFYSDLTTKNEVQVLINESITSALNASY